MSIENALLNVLPILCRSIGLFFVLPGLQSFFLKGSLSFGLALLFFNMVEVGSTLNALSIAQEFVIGWLLGLPIALLVDVANMSGELIDSGRGQTIGLFYNPQTSQVDSLTGMFFSNGLLALLFISGIGDHLIHAFGESLVLIPPGSVNINTIVPAAQKLLSLTVSLLASLMISVAGFMIIFLAIEASVGYVGKIVPQLSLQTESFLAKTVVTIIIFCLIMNSSIDVELFRLAYISLFELP